MQTCLIYARECPKIQYVSAMAYMVRKPFMQLQKLIASIIQYLFVERSNCTDIC